MSFLHNQGDEDQLIWQKTQPDSSVEVRAKREVQKYVHNWLRISPLEKILSKADGDIRPQIKDLEINSPKKTLEKTSQTTQERYRVALCRMRSDFGKISAGNC
jgi:hypothetical protein